MSVKKEVKKNKLQVLQFALLLLLIICSHVAYKIDIKEPFFNVEFFFISSWLLLCTIISLIYLNNLIKLNYTLLILLFLFIGSIYTQYIIKQYVIISNLVNWLSIILMSFYIYQFIRNKLSTSYIIYIFVFLSFIWSIVAISQFVTTKFTMGLGIYGFFNNSGFFGNYLIGLYPYVVSYTFIHFKVNKKIKLIILLVCTFAIIITLARAAYVGLVFSIFAIILFKLKNKISSNYLKYLAGLFITIILFTIYLLSILFKADSAYGRIQILNIGYRMFLRGFPFGLGLGQVYSHFNNFQAEYFSMGNHSIHQQLVAYNTFEVFNSILHIGIELGIIGIFAYAFLLYNIIKAGRDILKVNQYNPIYIGAFISTCSLIISSWFSNTFHHTPILIIGICSLCLLLKKHITLKHITLKCKDFLFNTTLFIIISILAFNLYLVIKNMEKRIYWKKAAKLALTENFKEADINYEYCYEDLSDNGKYLYNYGSELCVAGKFNKSIKILTKAKNYYNSSQLFTYLGLAYEGTNDNENAVYNYKYAINIMPSSFYPRFKLFNLYFKNNDTANAILSGNKMLNLPIKIKSAEVTQMRQAVKIKLAIISLEKN